MVCDSQFIVIDFQRNVNENEMKEESSNTTLISLQIKKNRNFLTLQKHILFLNFNIIWFQLHKHTPTTLLYISTET